MIRRPFLIGILLLSGLVDIPANIHLGAVSASGVLTVLTAVGLAALLASRRAASWRGFRSLWPFSWLLLLSLIQFFRHGPSLQAYQTICLLWIFVGLLVMLSTGEYDPQEARQFERTLLFATGVAASIYALSLLVDGLGTEAVIGPRSFAAYALPGLALLLGRWATGSRLSFWLAVGLTLLIALSLSRTGLVVAILLFPLSRLRSLTRRDAVRLALAAACSILVLYFLVTRLPALSSRFLGDSTLKEYVIGDAELEMSGRAAFWATTLDSYAQSPWFGNGPGSANNLIDEVFPDIAGHPHNEYLRWLHDSGVVGLGLLLSGLAQLLIRCRNGYQLAARKASTLSGLHLGAFLALVAILLTGITDNTFSYLYVMAPLGVILGITLQKSPARASLRAPVLGVPQEGFAPMPGHHPLQGSQP